MILKYFSTFRERIGLDEEEIIFAENIVTLIELIDYQKARNENFANAFSDTSMIRIAVDMKLIDDPNHNIENAKEVAFFPPMTGG